MRPAPLQCRPMISVEKRRARLAGSLTLCRALKASNGDDVAVLDVADIGGMKCDHGFGLPRGGDEFDLEAVRFVDLDNGTEIASPQAVLGQVLVEDDGIEGVKAAFPFPRIGGYEARDGVPGEEDPDGDDLRLAAIGSTKGTTNEVLAAVGRLLLEGGVIGQEVSPEVGLETLPARGGIAERPKEDGFEAPDGVSSGEEIAPELLRLDDGPVRVGDGWHGFLAGLRAKRVLDKAGSSKTPVGGGAGRITIPWLANPADGTALAGAR